MSDAPLDEASDQTTLPPAELASVLDALRPVCGDQLSYRDEFATHTVMVPREHWAASAAAVHQAGYQFYDWLSAVDYQAEGMQVVLCVWRLATDTSPLHQILLSTSLPVDQPHLDTLTGIYEGAQWGERETAEMFGIDFLGHPYLVPLLLPEQFLGHPLRKDFVLVSRAAKQWPGAKEPGEGHEPPASVPEAEAGPARKPRRRAAAMGVPDPEWGPRTPAEAFAAVPASAAVAPFPQEAADE